MHAVLFILLSFLCCLSLTVAQSGMPDSDTECPTSLGLHFFTWNGAKTCQPSSFVTPQSESEVIEFLKSTTGQVKVIGGGLSFSGIQLVDNNTGANMMSLEKLNKILKVHRLVEGGALVTVQAGIRLRDLAKQLDVISLAMPNMGATAQQSFAGAAATGTHGTGGKLGSIATQIVAFRMVSAIGEVHVASKDDNMELFNMARTGLGALGILTEVTLHVVDQWKMNMYSYATPLDSLLLELPSLLQVHPRLQWSWLPYSNNATVVIRTNVPIDTPLLPTPGTEGNLDGGCWADSGIPNPCTDVSYKCLTDSAEHFASRTLYTEMEMFVPLEHSIEAVRAFIEWMNTPEVKAARDPDVYITAMMRYVAADDILLSPMYARETAVLSFIVVGTKTSAGNLQQFDLFASGMQKVCEKQFQGRPHWGKVSYVDANTKKYLKSVYGGMDDFLHMARKNDPQGRFTNSFLLDRMDL